MITSYVTNVSSVNNNFLGDGGHRRERQDAAARGGAAVPFEYSKVLYIVTSHSKCTRALIFENLCQAPCTAMRKSRRSLRVLSGQNTPSSRPLGT
jgi:hypothetical protein